MKTNYITTATLFLCVASTILAQDELGSIINAAEFKKQAPVDSTSGLLGESNAATLKIGFIDLNRLFTEYPATKRAEESLNAERAKAKTELDQRLNRLKSMMSRIEQQSGSASKSLVEQARELDKEISEFRTSREKSLQDKFVQMRKKIIEELNLIIREVAEENKLNVLYDKSGMSMGQVPVVVYTKGVFDITDACIAKAKPR
jgi:outer membrane protein